MSTKMNVPELRFGEFCGNWEEKKLEEYYPKIRNGFVGTATPYYVNNGVLYLQGKNIKNGLINYKERIYIDEIFHNKQKKSHLKLKDILMVQSGHVGECAMVTEEYVDSNCHALLVLTPVKQVESKFFVYYFYSSYGKHLIHKIKTGNTIEHILSTDLKTVMVSVPNLAEQEKIASFLGSVDTKIEQLTKKKTLLEQYKKGVMQKIFLQEIRFKDDDGSEYPAWVEKKLGEIGKTFNGLTGKTKEDFGKGKPYIQYKQIFDNAKIDISKFGLVKIGEQDKQNIAKYGDVFFTTSSETPLEIGFTSVLLDEIEEVYLNSFCFGYRANSLKTLSPKFSRYLFRSSIFRRKIVKLAQGSTRYNMSKVELLKIKIKLPCLEEQIRIANFLSSLDTRISQIEQQLSSTKQFKKALLQKMFV